jgi:nucleoside-diphosphate-sugar epimerase
MIISIIGGSGFIGTRLVNRLAKYGDAEVHIIVNRYNEVHRRSLYLLAQLGCQSDYWWAQCSHQAFIVKIK